MGSLALTFDDGPDADGTPRLLELLEAHRARATFFPIAPRAAAQPALIDRMLAAGHEVGLHCCEHVRHSERSEAWCRRDTERGLALLASLGVRARLWRTPWGETAPWSARIAAEHRLRIVHWSVDTHDWRGDSAAEMLAATRPRLVPDAVVLAHDGIGPGARRATIDQTLGYVRAVAEHARAAGLRLAVLR